MPLVLGINEVYGRQVRETRKPFVQNESQQLVDSIALSINVNFDGEQCKPLHHQNVYIGDAIMSTSGVRECTPRGDQNTRLGVSRMPTSGGAERTFRSVNFNIALWTNAIGS